MTKYYRVYAQSYSTCHISESGLEEYGSTPLRLECGEFQIVKETAKGAWIDYIGGFGSTKPHFILHSSRKKFAYPTYTEALDGFIAKKRRQVSILAAQHDDALCALNLALEAKEKTA